MRFVKLLFLALSDIKYIHFFKTEIAELDYF